MDPKALLDEIAYVKEKGIDPKLLVSDRAHVIMPFHIVLDKWDHAIIDKNIDYRHSLMASKYFWITFCSSN